jgi:cell wall-associated NlpC family hydrolase
VIPAAALIAEARKLIGTPFRHQGHSVHGVDCLGLIYVAALNAGLHLEELPEFKRVNGWNYGRSADPQVLAHVSALCRPTPMAVPGCLLFFQFPRVAYPQHFAIYTGRNMIHADARRGVVEHIYGQPWVRQTHSMWLLPGVDYAS